MDRKEFLEVLRQSLNGEVNSVIIEQNIKYYDQYISAQSSKGEEKVIEELGSPRLIARTIIETERAAEQKGKHYNNEKYHSDHDNKDETKTEDNHNRYGRTQFYTNLTWRLKLTLILIFIILISLIIVIGRIIVGFLFTFGIPILIVILLLALFKRR